MEKTIQEEVCSETDRKHKLEKACKKAFCGCPTALYHKVSHCEAFVEYFLPLLGSCGIYMEIFQRRRVLVTIAWIYVTKAEHFYQ